MVFTKMTSTMHGSGCCVYVELILSVLLFTMTPDVETQQVDLQEVRMTNAFIQKHIRVAYAHCAKNPGISFISPGVVGLEPLQNNMNRTLLAYQQGRSRHTFIMATDRRGADDLTECIKRIVFQNRKRFVNPKTLRSGVKSYDYRINRDDFGLHCNPNPNVAVAQLINIDWINMGFVCQCGTGNFDIIVSCLLPTNSNICTINHFKTVVFTGGHGNCR